MRGPCYNTELTGQCGALRRDIMVVVGILALALNFLAGISFSARPFQTGSALSLSSLDRFVICSSSGSIVVDRDGNVVPGDDDGGLPPGHEPHCLFCLPLLQGSLLAPETAGIEAPDRCAHRSFALLDVSVRPARPSLAANLPRGPPAT